MGMLNMALKLWAAAIFFPPYLGDPDLAGVMQPL